MQTSQQTEIQNFRALLIDCLPSFAKLALWHPGQPQTFLCMTADNRDEALRAIRIRPHGLGMGLPTVMEDLDEHPRRVVAVVQTSATDLPGYDVIVSAAIASYGCQELLVEAIAGNVRSDEYWRGGLIEIGEIEPPGDPLSQSIDASLIV